MQVLPLAQQGNIPVTSNPGSLPALSMSQINTPKITGLGTATSQTPYTPSTLTDEARLNMVKAITKARADYPSQDKAILDRFVADNEQEHPDIVDKLKPYLQSGGNGRTGRNNNPTAMTTDVAAQLGLVNGKDYTQGDPFVAKGGSTLYTAKLNGDPIQTTIKAFDNAAQSNTPIFTTVGGKPRWSYINMTNDQWAAMSAEQKKATIQKMLKNEGGSVGNSYDPTKILDSIVNDNRPSSPDKSVGEVAGSVASDVGHGIVNFGKGYIKGTGNLMESLTRPTINWISKELGVRPEVIAQNEEAIKQEFTPNGVMQGIGNVAGKYIAPGAAALSLGGAGATALGVDIPAAASASKGAIGKLLSTKTGKFAGFLIGDAIANELSKTSLGAKVVKNIPLLKLLVNGEVP